jgi:hypothetical protein
MNRLTVEEITVLNNVLNHFKNHDKPLYKNSLKEKEIIKEIKVKEVLELTDIQKQTLASVLEGYVYNCIGFNTLEQNKIIEDILWKKLKHPRWCLIRQKYV